MVGEADNCPAAIHNVGLKKWGVVASDSLPPSKSYKLADDEGITDAHTYR